MTPPGDSRQDAGASSWARWSFSFRLTGRKGSIGVGLLVARLVAVSGGMAALQVAASLCMLVVYECVVRPDSVGTLARVLVLVIALQLVSAGLDLYRGRLLCRAGFAHVACLDRCVLEAVEARRGGASFALLDDVESVRRFLASTAPSAALDALWLPVFILAVSLLHPLLGLFACAGVLMLVRLTLAAETCSETLQPDLLVMRRDRYALAQGLAGCRMPSERPHGPGPAPCWRSLSQRYWALTSHAHVRALPVVAFGKGLRLILQSAGVGLGALLVMEGLINAGALFASSLMLGKIFAGLDGALAHRRGLLAARESHLRLAAAVAAAPATPARS